jgi:hypothetical protein
MKNGTFGKEKDIPIQKKDEKNISDEAELDLGDDDDIENSENEKKDDKEKEQLETNEKTKKPNFSSSSGEDSDKSSTEDKINKKEIKNEIKEEKEKENETKKKEEILLNSIKNKENATYQKIQMAEEINFGALPDKLINTDEYGFIIEKKSGENNETNNNNKDIDELLKINARMEKWNYMIENYQEFITKKFNKLKERTRKGVPDSLRSYVWQLFAEKDKYYEKDIFQKLESIKIKEELDTVIIKDLDRTYPNCQLFKDKYGNGQRKLYKVLSNYSKYNTSTGYVQGMGFIAAVFLTYMDEESSFFMLHSLMKKYELEGFYLPGFPELKKTFYILLNLEKKFIPKIYELFKKEGMIPSMYASEWFICLFSRNLEFQNLVRIFDVFLLEGYKVIYRFSLAFLKLKENEFLKGKDGLASIMQTINQCLENVDIENLFKIAFGFSLSRKDLDKLGKEYDKIKDNQNDEFVKQL